MQYVALLVMMLIVVIGILTTKTVAFAAVLFLISLGAWITQNGYGRYPGISFVAQSGILFLLFAAARHDAGTFTGSMANALFLSLCSALWVLGTGVCVVANLAKRGVTGVRRFYGLED